MAVLLPPPWTDRDFAFAGDILGPAPDAVFACPITGDVTRWAAKDLFNPGAVVRNGRIHLLVRAEDAVGHFGGTSRIGLAVSEDGGHTFSLHPEPVLFPDRDEWTAWEWPGGCEDPRVVESPDGRYVCCYSAFDGKSSCLMVASSDDLVHWDKHGPAFGRTRHARRWSKSGAIITEVREGRLRAAQIDGRFQMYWGEGTCFMATSDDLIHWEPVEGGLEDDRYVTRRSDSPIGSLGLRMHRLRGPRMLRPVLGPRPGRFDALLAEPGPPALLGKHGIVLVYNGGALRPNGVSYQPGSVVLDPQEPGSVIARPLDASPPTGMGQQEGQVDGVCFAQGLVLHDGRWILYLGLADSRVGYATAQAASPSDARRTLWT
jgi:beta-1,2-mannosidase